MSSSVPGHLCRMRELTYFRLWYFRFIFLILFLLGVNLSCMVPLFRRRSVTRELLYALNLHSEDVSEIWDIVSVALANLAA